MTTSLRTLLLVSCFTMMSTFSSAEQIIETDEYVIHYNAFNSTAIDANAAKEHNLIRSKVSAMLNIAVLKKSKDNKTTAQRSINSGTAENLVGQQQALNFVSINEDESIYYIASFRFVDEKEMKFNVSIQPDPNEDPISLRFSQTFYVE